MKNLNNYIANPTYKKLAAMMEKAKTQEEIDAVLKYQEELQENMTPEELAAFNEGLKSDFGSMMKAMDEDIEELQSTLELQKQIEPYKEILPFKYIAEHYFGKSAAWLSQRIKGTPVRGKVYTLKPAEIVTFNNAVHDIGARLGSISLC